MTAPTMFSGAHRVTQPGDDVDFFPTQPWAGRAGAEIVRMVDPHARTVWENACGAGHLVHALSDMFDTVHASDAWLYDGNVIHDVLGDAPPPFGPVDWVITNPPFSNILGFVRRAYAVSRRGVALLMPARVMEGVERHALLYGECPVTIIAPFSERLPMHKGCYDPGRSTAAFYAWFIWLKPCMRPRRFMVRMPRLAGGPRSSAPSGTSRSDAACGGFDWRPGVMPIPPGTKKRLFRRSDLRLAMGGEALAIAADLKADARRASEGGV